MREVVLREEPHPRVAVKGPALVGTVGTVGSCGGVVVSVTLVEASFRACHVGNCRRHQRQLKDRQPAQKVMYMYLAILF